MSHAKFAPSAADRWLACGYSVKMAAFFPNKETPATSDGVRHHAIAAQHLLDNSDSANPQLQSYLKEVRSSQGELLVERKVIMVPGLCWGTSDVIVLGDRALGVYDLKWGVSPVPAVNNPQLLLYAFGALREFPIPRNATVSLNIVQPRASSGWPVKTWLTTPDHILQFRPRLMAAIEEGLKENPKAVAGHHCYWCPAKLHCHAYLFSIGQKFSLLS